MVEPENKKVEEQPPAVMPSRRSRWQRALIRTGVVVLVAISVSYGLNRSAVHDSGERAGFGRGVVHGATMPLAMPGLLAGMDMTIYAAENTGRPYKLGYTLGVNACGAIFFGFVFRRLSRWRRSRSDVA
jgi:hypothetical protein